jgi:protein TonB
MYATDYFQQSAQQSVRPNKVGAVLVTIGAHAALIAMLAIGLNVVVPSVDEGPIVTYDVPFKEKIDPVEPLPPMPAGPVISVHVDEPIITTQQNVIRARVTDDNGPIIEGGGIGVRPEVQEVTTNASIVRSFQPAYPLVSRARDEEGTVIVKILITPFGTAGDVQVEKSSGFSRLDDAAVKAVRDWKFAPAKRGSQAISMWVSVPVKFVLNSGR